MDATGYHLRAVASLAIVLMRAVTQADDRKNIAYRPLAQTCPKRTGPTCAALPAARVRQAWPVRRMLSSELMPLRALVTDRLCVITAHAVMPAPRLMPRVRLAHPMVALGPSMAGAENTSRKIKKRRGKYGTHAEGSSWT